MVRVTLDGTLKASAIILAGSLSLAALAHAWAATTRTTATTPGGYPAVFRENLLTGRGRFCGVSQDGRASCVALVRPGAAFATEADRPVARGLPAPN